MNTTKRTLITSMLSGYQMKIVALALLAFGVTAEAQAQLKVSVMPSHTQSSSYAKVGLNEAINVWGRTWGGTGAQTYTLDFGDGTAPATGTVTNANYIGASHVYTSGGLKTFTLTVTDSTATAVSRSGVIRVIAGPVHADRVHMAIEKGLLNLYQNSTVIDASRIHWQHLGGSYTSDYGVGATASALIAFEENDHLPGEDDVEEIYAETIRRGLNTLFGQATAFNIAFQHSDGIAVRDTDMNDNSRGIYLNLSGGHAAYSTPFAGMAIILAKRNAAESQASTVPYGPFAGVNYFTFVQDMVDQLHWTQGDGSYRGGFGYSVTTASQDRFDGSSQQWPALMLLAAEERLGVHTPQWWLDNAAYGFSALTSSAPNAGGIAYYSANDGWTNTAKTGGALALYSFAGKMAGTDANATAARDFIQTNWANNAAWYGDRTGWAGQWYAMWALKKGLQLQGITTLQTGTGARNWKQDMQAWLLGNASLLDSQGAGIAPGYRSINYMFGQQADGSWRSQETPGAVAYGGSAANTIGMDTAHGVLILSEAVARPVPVAVIAAVGSQSNRAGFRSFDMDGTGSYHSDANSSIIEYLWDWNAADGVDWANPDATGPRPNNPGYATVGNYTVTLRVKDNQNPFETGTSTIVVNVIDTDIAPVAVAIPASLLPAYAGHVGQPIQLNGTASYDPDLDAITLYSWDTDGNGTYGDATGPNPTVTFNTPYVGQVGLRVTANGKTSTNSAVADIYASPNDFYIESISSSNIVLGSSADVQVVVKNATGSTGTWNGVTVRFYTGDPLVNGVQIGSNYTVNLPPQGTATLNASLTNLNGLQVVYAYVDATKVIPEWDERNNTASVNVMILPNVAPSFVIGTAGGNASINGLTVGGSTYFAAGGTSVVVAPDLTYTNSVSATTSGAQVSIDNGQVGDVLGWDTTITSANGISGSYNSTTKVLAFSGSATTAVYQSLLRSVTYSNAAGTPTTTRTISFNVGQNTLYNPTNGHFYEYIASGTNWTNAKNAAAAKTFNGLQGYLATVTSQGENDFIQTKLQADAWIGASDDPSFGASEGNWFWVTGPEAGTQFSTGSSSFSGRYQRWAPGEPNNSGGENYAEFYTTSSWNDLNGTQNLAYVVEYGGMPGDPASTLSLTGSRSVIYKPIVAEDTGAYTDGTTFITGISPGPANESSQTVSFTVTNNNNALFSVQPAIDASGTLTFTPAPDAFGSATVSVTAVDDGGTANGGADTSAAKTFVITVTPVIDPPEIVVEQPADTILVDGTASVDFGTNDVAETASLTFTVKNMSPDAALSLGAITFSGATPADFKVTTAPAASVVNGGSTTFVVTFQPLQSGARTAVMHIPNNDADENPFDITLTGKGTNNIGSALPDGVTPVLTLNGADFVATGLNFETDLGFAPTPGQKYTFVDIVNPANGVVGNFNDLPEDGVVAMSFNGVIYYFQAEYTGGTGNDLVLTAFTPAAPPAWKWLAGPNARNGAASFGTLNTPAPTNNPGARQGAMNWRDEDGSLWMFGGYGYATAITNPPRYLNDLWQYDRTLGQWIWRSGATVHNAAGVYGTINVEAAGNTPGSRHTGTTWTDGNSNLWLFGGFSLTGRHNDLWRYNPTTGLWAWMKGSNVIGQVGDYTNADLSRRTPGARQGAVGWSTPDGSLWLFGGTTNGSILLNDLWRYDIASGNWTWVSGSNTTGATGIYGTQGTPAPANVPGARRDATGWVAANGDLWLFGGLGLPAAGITNGDLNDLWRYNPTTNQWTWMKGTNTTHSASVAPYGAVYGTQGTPNAANTPGGRSAGSGWVTADGKFWLVGGFRKSSLTFSDVWLYDTLTNEWVWMQGASTTGAAGVYGTLGVADPANQPGARFTPATWVTLNGSLWIFGGGGIDGSGNSGRLSDLWSYGVPMPGSVPYEDARPDPFPDELIVNADPNASDATASTMAYVPVSGIVSGSDADGDKIYFSSASSTVTTQGTLTLNPDGTWTYIPSYGFTGTASFSFKASDSYGGESPVRSLIVTVATNSADSDGDGIADAYEQEKWGSLAAAAGDGDADLDGQSNYFEFLAGTDPLNGNEHLRTAPSVSGAGTANGTIKLKLDHVRPGVNYHLETSTDLDAWSRIGTFTFSTAGSAEIEDPNPSTSAPRFYRMNLEATPAVILP